MNNAPLAPLLVEIAGIMTCNVPPDRREKTIQAAVGKASKQLGYQAFLAAVMSGAIAARQIAAVGAPAINDNILSLAGITSTAAMLAALAHQESAGHFLMMAQDGICALSTRRDLAPDLLLHAAAWAASHNYGAWRTLPIADTMGLVFGEIGQDEAAPARFRLLPELEASLPFAMGLLAGGARQLGRGLSPATQMAAIFHHGMTALDREDREAFRGLPVVPSPDEARRDIVEHARYALWPGITEVFWHEGSLRRVRLRPADSGVVLAAIEIAGDDDSVTVAVREIFPPTSDDPTAEAFWASAVENFHEDITRGVVDPLYIAIEAMRMCVVAKDRKISPQAPRRVPTGMVSGARQPSGGDIPLRYVPRHTAAPTRPETETLHRDDMARRPGGHRAHLVAGHIRQIPQTAHASAQCRAAAQASGIGLPNAGFTFVRPHVRGRNENGEDAPTMKVRARRKTEGGKQRGK
ncbi:MAG: hypothetical protein EOM10_09500 [Opitutae bacterium]|nr:hypothetical protein [Opitutae bacterium]